MRHSLEQTEAKIQKVEARVEQVQETLQELREQLCCIAEAVARLEQRGEAEIAALLDQNLMNKQERERSAQDEVAKCSAALDEIQSRLDEMQSQNVQAGNEISALSQIGEDVGVALEEIAERDASLKQQEQQVRALRERLGCWAAADTFVYQPRVHPPISEQVRWVDDGIRLVPVKQLPPPEGISGPADFQKVSEGEMRAGLLKLQEMRSAIESGMRATTDAWRAYDEAHGLAYEDGYQRIYEVFFGMDAIKVTFDGENYDVIGGRHRIWLAQQMGIEYLPMRVTRKVEIRT